MMDLGTVLVFLALLVLVGLYVARPLMDRRSVSVSDEELTLSALMAERDRLLDAIQELDFDQNLGKIPADVYPEQRAELLSRGAEVMRKIDVFQEQYQIEDADLQLEAAIAARRGKSETVAESETLAEPEPVLERVLAGGGLEDDQLEDLIATRRQGHDGKAAGFCHQCGQAIKKNDRFCANCGTTVGPQYS